MIRDVQLERKNFFSQRSRYSQLGFQGGALTLAAKLRAI
jgi:hypothetical protein